MAEFFNVLPPDEARALLLAHVRPTGETEVVPLSLIHISEPTRPY